eukprot:CAMPEP_0175039508 /NCGR_PEP_ID=MMETSP0052_2-20121109/630_1 /TAXON_ID=51329 ORGANISM="Polytomella parva, Strain SAG 63-3" /NCGR_SAMPLE_ID=MMETSP0052_2 /ASSEMBLY_ACC=CAM_ASM_000194 /LENGTH=479 /DNA_ID=CAMNT_0016301383 /DNA_START=141 /DNA_END=1576 /DNA_ORIENTATION=+
MRGSGEELLPQTVLRQIGDKMYEKRKLAALEVEQIIKRLAQQNDQHRIRIIIDKLIGEFAFSAVANHRKGALLCLAAATVGLGAPSEAHLRQIVPPVLASFTDQDSRVRYYACEALYNIAKVARSGFVIFFPEAFDALFRLSADSESNVQNAVQFLDSLVKDVVTACPSFDVHAFIPKLRDYLRVVNPHKRQFLISWVVLLNSIPDLDMISYLPQLLDGILAILSDVNREIRQAAFGCLHEFLVDLRRIRRADFGSLTAILVDRTAATDELVRLTSLSWLGHFVSLAPNALLGQLPQLLASILSNVSHSNAEIHGQARKLSVELLGLPPGPARKDVPALLLVLHQQLSGSTCDATRLEILHWLHLLLRRAKAEVLLALPHLLPQLLDLQALGCADEVQAASLAVLAAVASCDSAHFQGVLRALLDRYRGPSGALLLQHGGSGVLRRLCAHLGGRHVFMELAGILRHEPDLGFAATVVQA